MSRRPRAVELSGIPLVTVRDTPLAGAFVDRPHRFMARVALADGSVVEAHLPNPGRLTGTVAPGRRVLLDGPFPPPRKLPWTLVAARERRAWVGTVTTFANRIFPELWRRGLFPELPKGELASEVACACSRFDFRIDRTFVEVKSVTFARGSAALFPDAVTARGARHCLELAELARGGTPTAIVLLAQRGDVVSIAPEDDIDPRFGKALREAAAAGVVVLGAALELAPAGPKRAARVPLLL